MKIYLILLILCLFSSCNFDVGVNQATKKAEDLSSLEGVVDTDTSLETDEADEPDEEVSDNLFAEPTALSLHQVDYAEFIVNGGTPPYYINFSGQNGIIGVVNQFSEVNHRLVLTNIEWLRINRPDIISYSGEVIIVDSKGSYTKVPVFITLDSGTSTNTETQTYTQTDTNTNTYTQTETDTETDTEVYTGEIPSLLKDNDLNLFPNSEKYLSLKAETGAVYSRVTAIDQNVMIQRIEMGSHQIILQSGNYTGKAQLELSLSPSFEADRTFIKEINIIEANHDFSVFDKFSKYQFNLDNKTSLPPVNGGEKADIRAKAAWSLSSNCEDIVIAVVDTGVDWQHPDLIDNIWVNEAEMNGVEGYDDDGNGYVDDKRGWDFVDGDNNPMDLNGHGTHVSGILGARGNNNGTSEGPGIAGVCHKVKIMPLRFLDEDGDGYPEDAIKAVQYARNMGAHVINNSWGGPAGLHKDFILDVVQEDDPLLFVFATGNESVDLNEAHEVLDAEESDVDYSPLTEEERKNVIFVGATNIYDELAYFSNYGSDWADIAAPGMHNTKYNMAELDGEAGVDDDNNGKIDDIIIYRTGILSTVPQNLAEDFGVRVNNQEFTEEDKSLYQTALGTSMSVPQVSGAAALIMQYHDRNLGPSEVREIILNSADQKSIIYNKIKDGKRLNLYRNFMHVKDRN